MANVRVRLRLKGINQLMASQKVQDRLDEIGDEMANDAGDGFEYAPSPHKWTARGFVQTSTGGGARRQADEAVLERVAGTKRS
ncbi:MAG: hypothetical protein ACTH31_03865 [Pseudoclavibacter sp.]